MGLRRGLRRPRPDRRRARPATLHAFGVLYERHVGAVRGLARRLCGNPADADDVVADVFTNTLARRSRAAVAPRDEMRSYVLTAARHTVIKLQHAPRLGRAIPRRTSSSTCTVV